MHVVFLCTGNAARSVMATVMFRARRGDVTVTGAGTHALPGHPMSVRTRTALAQFELADPTHRSSQFDETDVDRADLVVAMAPEHVEWVRRTHPAAAARTATLKRLVRDLDRATDRPLSDRLAVLALDRVELGEWEEVVDPAGGEQEDFDGCAREIDALVNLLIARL